jgi:hypothetical protein
MVDELTQTVKLQQGKIENLGMSMKKAMRGLNK